MDTDTLQDLEEIEEWNEYGELQDNIGSGPKISTPSASTNVTPSKPPSAPVEEKQSRAAGGSQTPITLAMRQAGEEAARKAGEMKQGNSAKAGNDSKSTTSEPLQKLDSSAPIPPPSGTTNAPSSASSTSLVESESPEPPKGAVSKHRGSSVSVASAEEIRSIEQSLAITEEDEPDEEAVDTRKKSTESNKVTATSTVTDTDEEQNLPGSTTQTQSSASAEDAGQSVGD